MGKKKKGINKKYLIPIFTFPILLLVSIFVLGVGLPIAEQVKENPLTVPLPDVEVEDIIASIPEEIIIDIPPVTSEDPIEEQINENLLGIDQSIEIGLVVQRIDSIGNMVREETTTQLPALSLFYRRR